MIREDSRYVPGLLRRPQGSAGPPRGGDREASTRNRDAAARGKGRTAVIRQRDSRRRPTVSGGRPRTLRGAALAFVVLLMLLAVARAAREPDWDPECLAPGVHRAIVMYRPRLWHSPDDLADLDAVLPAVRRWVAAAGPRDVKQAARLLRPAARFAIWARQGLFMDDPEQALTPPFVKQWIEDENASRSESWKTGELWALSALGRVVAPAAWPDTRIDVGDRPVPDRYSADQEQTYRQSAVLEGRQNRAGRAAGVALSLGGGARGPEIFGAVPDDLFDLDGGRIAVRLRGRNSRVVPLRAAYTDTALLAVEAHLAAGRRADQPFIADSSALMHIGEGLGAHGADGTPEGMSLSRARVTWICAHLEGGTPLSALRKLAGPIAERTLTLLLAQTAAELGDDEAVAQGLGA